MPKKINLIGQKYGKLTVLSEAEKIRTPNGRSHVAWLCECECGKQVVVRSDCLRNGHTTSCGCRYLESAAEMGRGQKKDLTGQTFGYLTVIKDSGLRTAQGEIKWTCKCICGQEVDIIGYNLTRKKGGTISCGCKKSRGEAAIIKSLIELKIPFVTQKRFKNCIFPDSEKQLIFDFYLPELNLCIEYDGIQHFEEVKQDFFNFESVKKRDTYKNQWCKENNIPLKRIPYWELKNLTIEDIMGDKFLLKEIKEKNE